MPRGLVRQNRDRLRPASIWRDKAEFQDHPHGLLELRRRHVVARLPFLHQVTGLDVSLKHGPPPDTRARWDRQPCPPLLRRIARVPRVLDSSSNHPSLDTPSRHKARRNEKLRRVLPDHRDGHVSFRWLDGSESGVSLVFGWPTVGA